MISKSRDCDFEIILFHKGIIHIQNRFLRLELATYMVVPIKSVPNLVPFWPQYVQFDEPPNENVEPVHHESRWGIEQRHHRQEEHFGYPRKSTSSCYQVIWLKIIFDKTDAIISLNKNYQLTDNGIMIISKSLAINTKLICTNSIVNLVIRFFVRTNSLTDSMKIRAVCNIAKIGVKMKRPTLWTTSEKKKSNQFKMISRK